MDERFAQYEPHVRKAWASVHLELTRVAKEKRILRQRSPHTKRLLEESIQFHPKPRGRAPTGKSWDPIYGEWTDTSPKKMKSKTKANQNKSTAVESFLSAKNESPNRNNRSTTKETKQAKGKSRQKLKEKATKHSSNETVSKRQTRSAGKQKHKDAQPAAHSPLIDPKQQHRATKIVTASSSTTVRVQMPSPKRLETTLEENLGGFLALEATPPRHTMTTTTTTSRPKSATSPIPKLLLTSKGDALATMWGVPRKTMSPPKTEKRRASDSNNRVALQNESGGMLAEISNKTRKRKSSTERKLVAKKKFRVDDTSSVVIRESKQPLVQKQDGTFNRPRGKAPLGFDWDEQGGAWVSKVDVADKQRRSIVAAKSKKKTAPTERLKQRQAIAKDSARPSAKVQKNTAKEPVSPPKATNCVVKHSEFHRSHSTADETHQRTGQNSPSKSKSGNRELKQTEIQRNRNITEGILQNSPQNAPSKAKEYLQNSPGKSKDHHRSQIVGIDRGNTPEKKLQRKIVPTDSLYSPARSDSSRQQSSKTSSRLSPRSELNWDSSKDDTLPQLYSPPEHLLPRKRKEPDQLNRPLQSVLKQPRLAQGTSPLKQFNRSPHFDTATSSMLASPAARSAPRSSFHHMTSGTPDGSRGSHRSRSRTQTIFARPHWSDSSRKQRLSMQFAVHAPTYTAQPLPTESRDYVACGDCLNCRLPINCGACLLCKNSLHFGSLFPSCVRRICVSPVLPPLQRVAMVQFSATKRPTTPVGSPPRRSPKKLIGSGNGLLGSFGKYRDKDENSMDESEPAPSKASVQTDDNTDIVESLHPDSDDDISDF